MYWGHYELGIKKVFLLGMILVVIIASIACGNKNNIDVAGDAASLSGSDNNEAATLSDSVEKDSIAISSASSSTIEVESLSESTIVMEVSDNSSTSESTSNEVEEKASQDTTVIENKMEESSLAQYGRILFIGDSRTVDIFSDSAEEISGMNVDGITVYARNGGGDIYMTEVLDGYGMDSFDTLVTWMGANDWGEFAPYIDKYGTVLGQGKTLIVCTVGPSDNNTLLEDDKPYYYDETIQSFNNQLVEWASGNGVKVIDLYTYVKNNVAIDPADGIHYYPRPTSSIWTVILENL